MCLHPYPVIDWLVHRVAGEAGVLYALSSQWTAILCKLLRDGL
jgi:hypothetical protein